MASLPVVNVLQRNPQIPRSLGGGQSIQSRLQDRGRWRSVRSYFVFVAEAVPELGCVNERRGLLFLAIVYYLGGYAGNLVAEFGIDGAIDWQV